MTAATRARGFTLIEIIVSLVLLGILASTVFSFMGQAVRGFFIARDAMELTQKAQVALNKMRIELTYASAVTTPSASSVTYTADFPTGTETHTIALAGGVLTLDGVTLIDDVGGFTVAYNALTKLVSITLVMLDASNNTATFTTAVVADKIS
jgi:prepilin-type N-terminal cleavage/methylation domain-containing protein